VTINKTADPGEEMGTGTTATSNLLLSPDPMASAIWRVLPYIDL
jgi:hypothetical protein